MLIANTPPWHLWGNTQRMTLSIQSPTNELTFGTQQLIKVSYRRPESWHWVLAARLVEGVDADALNAIIVLVHFDITIGLGRSMIQMPVDLGVPAAFGQQRPFETYRFEWGNGASVAFPRNASIYTTQVLAPNRFFSANVPQDTTGNAVPGNQSASVITQIVAEEIQLQARAQAVTFPGSPFQGQNITIEVSALFAPIVHVRPDWFLIDKDLSEQFSGGEIGGK